MVGGRRVAFANDPLNLLSVDAQINRAKGDGDAATWLPPTKRFRCDQDALLDASGQPRRFGCDVRCQPPQCGHAYPRRSPRRRRPRR